MKTIISYIFLFCLVHMSYANPAVNLKFSHVGNGHLHGAYSLQQGVHKLSGGGLDVWNKSDNCDFASVSLMGDVQIVARVVSLQHANVSSKAGIMIRNTTTPESMIAAMYYSQKELSFEYRAMRRNSGRSNEISTVVKLPYWLKIIRKGDLFISQRSADGNNWHTVEIKTLKMDDAVCYGLAVTSQDSTKLAEAEFDNVSIEKFDASLSQEMENSIVKTHDLYSSNVKDSFRILVGLPLNYNSADAINYPVAYHLDGGDVEDHYIIRNFMTDELVPEVITVGIGYPKSENQRERDYRGGFDKFYAFLKDELVPFIDKHYKTNPKNRTLSGYSYGGLGCFQTLYKYGDDAEDMPFRGILAGSPTLWWSPFFGKNNFEREAGLYKQTKKLPINFYMSMGSAEGRSMVPNFKKMSEILKNRNYQNFNIETKLNKGLNHDSNKKVCYRDGYLWLLNQNLPESE